ncbi:MAG: hypothetical protein QM758_26370 [Armatimonas sp.]
MIRLLVCAATEFEVACFPDRAEVARVVTGVGIPHTLLRLPRYLTEYAPAQVLNIGIAGAYPDCELGIGNLICAVSEVYGDIGFEQTDSSFQPIQGSPFGQGYESYALSPLMHRQGNMASGGGCTVNSCTGTRATGEFRRDCFKARFETMEGAAVAQVCNAAGIPVSELRAISNIAAERDMRPENIRLALERLKDFLHQWEM